MSRAAALLLLVGVVSGLPALPGLAALLPTRAALADPSDSAGSFGSGFDLPLFVRAADGAVYELGYGALYLTGARAAANAYDHRLAVLRDGMVRASGGNEYGQLGDGTTTPTASWSTWVPASGLTAVVAVAAAFHASFALKADGTVWAWGRNPSDFPLGVPADGTCAGVPCTRTPAQVAGLQDVRAIAPYTALKQNGTVWTWGATNDCAHDPVATPQQVAGLSGVTPIASYDGFRTRLAATSGGAVYSWGDNTIGQAGQDRALSVRCHAHEYLAVSPTAIPTLSNVRALASELYHSVAINGDGVVYAWGDNESGQLGDGEGDTWRHTPQPVVGPGGSGVLHATAIGVGAVSSYALTGGQFDGVLYGWGETPNGVTTLPDCGGSCTFTPQLVDEPALTAPNVALTPTGLTFPAQAVGTTSAAQTVTLANTGTAALTIGGIAASGDFAQTNTCGTTLNHGASCTISVTFTPTATGQRTGALTITDSATGSPHTVALSGTGTNPVVTLSPAALTFGPQPAGTISAPQTVTLTNNGSVPLTISAVTASGDFVHDGGCAGTVAPGGSCAIGVTFNPTVAGTRSGTLTITDSAVGSPRTVPLTGTGTGAPAVTLSPTSLTFAKQQIGATGPLKSVTLTNSGTGPLTISGLSASGDFQVDSSTQCLGTVQPGATCTIYVRFVATATDQRTGTLTITDNAAGSPHTVSLLGEGPTRGFIFVHGITENYRDYELGANANSFFGALFTGLQGHYGIPNTTTQSTSRYFAFQSYEDRGNAGSGPGGGCLQRPPQSFTAPAGFPANLNAGQPVCDSNDDIGVNAVLLDQDVQRMASRGVDRITIISNSMGGAITRAYLAYATATQSSSLSKLDAIVFLHGAQQGSWLGVPNAFINQAPLLHEAAVKIRQETIKYNLDLNRPAMVGLTPDSALYQFINRPQYVPSYLFYANVASDMTLLPYTNVLGAEVFAPPMPIGDFLLLPGGDDPTSRQPLGGARFAPTGTRGTVQWILPRVLPPLLVDANVSATITTLIFGTDESHFVLDQSIDRIPTAPGHTLNQDLLDWIFALDRVP